MTDNKRYQFDHSMDMQASSNFDKFSNQNFNNNPGNYNKEEINNLNLNNINQRVSGINKKIPKEIDDLFDDSFTN